MMRPAASCDIVPAVQSAAPEQARTCRPVYFQALPGLPKSAMTCCPLPREAPRERLLAEFQAAPQFAQVRLRRLMEEHRGNLRVLLLADSGYYAAQAAVYLETLFRSREGAEQGGGGNPEPDFWDSVDFSELEDPEEEESAGARLRRSLAVVSPEMLDPALRPQNRRRAAAVNGDREEAFTASLQGLDAPAVLITAPSGPVLTARVLEQVEGALLRDARKPLDLFIALKSGQMDAELVEELRLLHGFQIARIGRPDQAYLCRFLRQSAEDLLCPIDKLADLNQVVSHTRRIRGASFRETDLECLVAWAVQNHARTPLGTQDLLFRPLRSAGREGWERLERMTGLEEVKLTLRRLLASAVREGRRRQEGRPAEPMCRNLAFAGPPGTGKSVTARLAAQILREEGCGTGRFVEAGREQLIGTYLGETSPKVAELFERARGGVLFIDEAGALLDGGRDIYACEAVNALVRHMELEPETMVIFATYPGEMERLLSANPGLSSRVAQVLRFPGYDDAALWEIFRTFAREREEALPEGAEAVCRSFFAALRRRKGESFGNGREARRLFQGAVEETALRTLGREAEPEGMILQDLENAARRLEIQPGQEARTIGFGG